MTLVPFHYAKNCKAMVKSMKKLIMVAFLCFV